MQFSCRFGVDRIDDVEDLIAEEMADEYQSRDEFLETLDRVVNGIVEDAYAMWRRLKDIDDKELARMDIYIAKRPKDV